MNTRNDGAPGAEFKLPKNEGERPVEKVQSTATPTRKDDTMEGTPGIDPNLLLAKMNDGGDDDKTLWLFLLLMMFGKDGFGNGGAAAAAGVRDDATLADLNAAQNSLMQAIAGGTSAISERTLDITRDQASNALRNETGQRSIAELVTSCCFNLQSGQCDIREAVGTVGTQLALGHKDIEKAICDCCCQLGIGQKELENTLIKCCCETQNQMAQGFAEVNHNACMSENRVTLAIHADGEMTRALITQNRMDDLQGALAIARDENSNLRQTERLAEIVREQCGHHGGGGRGFAPEYYAQAPPSKK